MLQPCGARQRRRCRLDLTGDLCRKVSTNTSGAHRQRAFRSKGAYVRILSAALVVRLVVCEWLTTMARHELPRGCRREHSRWATRSGLVAVNIDLKLMKVDISSPTKSRIACKMRHRRDRFSRTS